MNVESIVLQIEREANNRQADVFIRLLKNLDKDTKNNSACMKHESLRAKYAHAAIKCNYIKNNNNYYSGHQFLKAISTLKKAQKAYRISVYKCGCSDKYTACGNKKSRFTK